MLKRILICVDAMTNKFDETEKVSTLIVTMSDFEGLISCFLQDFSFLGKLSKAFTFFQVIF